ncbi:exonuclease domain-containing protein [Corynebacterium hindlerae]|uniref:exonuclease domain-containing protein n=1 Tax=Corynebacterium hindlerae TaxID=699041 RepID=UPI003AAD5ACD
MIAAHGAHLNVTPTSVDVHYSPLLTALQFQSRSISLAEVTGTEVVAPTSVLGGRVTLLGVGIDVTFSPGQDSNAQEFCAAVEAALSGETIPSSGSVPGLNFVAFDVETANADWGSICQIGAVRFQDGLPTESESWFVSPPPGLEHFDPDNVAIHGITQTDVESAPAFPQRLTELTDFVGELPMVAHNAQFDFTALSRASMACGITPPRFVFGCTLLMARAAQLGFENNRLPTVASGLGVDLTKHHDATADAAACGGIAVALARRDGFTGSFVDMCFSRGFTMGLLEPHRVYPVLRDRSGAGVAVQRTKLGLAPETKEAPVSDATPRPRETGRSAPWARVATPEVIPDPNPDADPAGPLFGQNVTLTGDFAPFEKGDLWDRIAERGGSVGKNVTKKTTIVVCGPWATVTSKQKRAEELMAQGQEISLWDRDRLYEALELNEQPPF